MGIPRFFGPYIGENQPGRVFNPGMAPRPGSVHQQRSRSRVELLESLVYHCHHTKYGYCLFRARFQELPSHSDGKIGTGHVYYNNDTPGSKPHLQRLTRISPALRYFFVHRINARTYTNVRISALTALPCGRTQTMALTRPPSQRADVHEHGYLLVHLVDVWTYIDNGKYPPTISMCGRTIV